MNTSTAMIETWLAAAAASGGPQARVSAEQQLAAVMGISIEQLAEMLNLGTSAPDAAPSNHQPWVAVAQQRLAMFLANQSGQSPVTGGWHGGAHLQGGNVVLPGGASLIGGKVFVPR